MAVSYPDNLSIEQSDSLLFIFEDALYAFAHKGPCWKQTKEEVVHTMSNYMSQNEPHLFNTIWRNP